MTLRPPSAAGCALIMQARYFAPGRSVISVLEAGRATFVAKRNAS